MELSIDFQVFNVPFVCSSVNYCLPSFWIHFYSGLFALPPSFRDFSLSIPKTSLLSVIYIEVSCSLPLFKHIFLHDIICHTKDFEVANFNSPFSYDFLVLYSKKVLHTQGHICIFIYLFGICLCIFLLSLGL